MINAIRTTSAVFAPSVTVSVADESRRVLEVGAGGRERIGGAAFGGGVATERTARGLLGLPILGVASNVRLRDLIVGDRCAGAGRTPDVGKAGRSFACVSGGVDEGSVAGAPRIASALGSVPTAGV